MQKQQLSKRYLSIFLAVCMIIAPGLIFQSSVSKYFVQPVALAFWAAWRIILSINQEIYWSGLIIVGLLLALRLAPTRGQAPSRYQYDEHPKPVPELEKWYSLLTSAPYQASDSLEVNEYLHRLFASLVELNNGDERGSTSSWKDKLPPGLSASLYPGHQKAWQGIPMWAFFKQRVWGKRTANAYYDGLEGALKLIESEMENQNVKFRNS